MEKITYLLVCQEVLASDKDQIIRNPLYLLTPLNIPGNYSFTVAVGLAHLSENTQYKLKLDITFPDDKIFTLSEANITVPPKPIEGENQIFEGNLNFGQPNFEFYLDGLYKLSFTLEKEAFKLVKETEFLVKKKFVEG